MTSPTSLPSKSTHFLPVLTSTISSDIINHNYPKKTSLNYPKNESELTISYKSYRVWAQKVYMNNPFGVGRRREEFFVKSKNYVF